MKNRLFLTLAIAVAGVAVTLTTAARPASANVPWHPNQVPSPFGNPCPFATSALPLIAASMAKDGSGQLYLSGELFTPCASVSIYISDSDMPGSRYLAGTAIASAQGGKISWSGRQGFCVTGDVILLTVDSVSHKTSNSVDVGRFDPCLG